MTRFLPAALLLPLCTALSLPSFAQSESKWFEIASSSPFKWEGKVGSGSMTTVDGKKNFAYVYVYQRTDQKNDKILLRSLFVSTRDCQRGYGLAVHNSLDGEFDSKENFVRNGPTVADALGTVACNGLDELKGVTPPAAGSLRWDNVASNKDGQKAYHLLSGSEKKTTYNKQPAISVLLREEDKQKNSHVYYEYVIPRSECQRGHGKSYFLNFSGKLEFHSEFAREGSSINSAISDAACAMI